jgi:hypothetical protein
VAVSTPTPESASPDPIESEILDSVPKQWMAKAQLSMKKWKPIETSPGTRKGNWNTRDKPFKEATWWI